MGSSAIARALDKVKCWHGRSKNGLAYRVSYAANFILLVVQHVASAEQGDRPKTDLWSLNKRNMGAMPKCSGEAGDDR